MLLAIVMAIFCLFIFGLAAYLFHYATRPFLIFNPKENQGLATSMRITGWLLLIVGIVGIVGIWFNNKAFDLSILLVASFISAFFALNLKHYV